jgi:uncharacterized protein (TIGR00730 family)
MSENLGGPREAEREKLVAAIFDSPSYRLAHEDLEFLAMDDLRPLRLQLELLKPEWYLRANQIRSTVVVFGSARIPPPDVARDRHHRAVTEARAAPDGLVAAREVARKAKELDYSRYYEEACRFGETVSRRFQEEGRRDFVVVTGGGPGIMEAANLGACRAGGRSVGLNITLPHEQRPNPYATPELCFRFRYFALRKMHFLLRAKALVAFPGGFGTFDEVFEVLTLLQTKKLPPIPVVLVGAGFWRRAVDFDFLIEEGMIGEDDVDHFRVVESAEEVVGVLYDFYGGKPPPPPPAP